MIIGMDVLSQHEAVELQTGGKLPKITCALFPVMKIQPPEIFSSGLPEDMKPISTRFRYKNPRDTEFMQDETKKLLDSGVIEKSTSPWRAQAFVVREGKPRMVIDYSETINIFTKLDAYPLTTMEAVLDAVAKNNYFSRIDLKSAYHQVPLKPEDRQYTAFEADGELFQFTRLPFGLKNAVPVFQKIMNGIIKDNELQKTYAYLDDITVCGQTLEEHDKNLEGFMKVAEANNLTINKEKSAFRQRKISLLGHVIEGGTKRPDPERLKPLMEFSLPDTMPKLRRLIGFFAYYAKWIPDYSNKIRPLLKAQENSLPLSNDAVATATDTLKKDISRSLLVLPIQDAGPLTIETDASGAAIGGTLSQAGRPIAFFSRTLSASEQKMSTVEREAMAIVEATRRWSEYLHSYHCIIKTDQKSISYIYSNPTSRIKNEKLARWRLELSEFDYDIVYRTGRTNVAADSLSRIASLSPCDSLLRLHEALAHPGTARMWEYVQRQHLPHSLQEVKELTANCVTCLECKPRYFNPSVTGRLIRATRPFERLNIDILGPKTPSATSGRRFILVIVDEYSRFPFASTLKDITTDSVILSLKQLFSMFGPPSFIHSDRGSQFLARDFDNFLAQHGISHSRTTPYNPQANGQVERYNGVIWKSVRCILHSRNLPLSMWESVLPEALAANRTLLCTATNETPHSRLFTFPRRATHGFSLPKWLANGKEAYLKRVVRNKDEPEVQPVHVVQVVNPYFARVEKQNGEIDTVSTRYLSPGRQNAETPSCEPLPEDSNEEMPEPTDVPTTPASSRPTRNRQPPDRLQIHW
jgi:transposase InsO family protein